MTPVFSLPALPIQIAHVAASLPIQAVDFEALLSATTAPVSEPASAPPQVQESAPTMVTAPEVDIDVEIMPLLATFDREAVPQSVSDEDRVADIDSIETAQRQSAEIVVPNPIVVPVQVAAPIIAAVSVGATVLPFAAQKDVPPVMDRDTELNSVSVPSANVRQPTLAAPKQLNPADPIAVADLAALFAATPVESNSVSGAGFQALITDRIAEPAVRPLTDASAQVADRALDVARGSLWLDQLAGDIAAVQDEGCELAFRLIPPQLGQLDVKIASGDNGMQLNFSTQTDEAAQIISNAQSRLVEELKSQGVRVAGSEVNAGSGQPSFTQQNGQSARAPMIAEFDRPSNDFPESTPPNEPPNGRFA
jgi:flagellar hook-length control protein FliK